MQKTKEQLAQEEFENKPAHEKMNLAKGPLNRSREFVNKLNEIADNLKKELDAFKKENNLDEKFDFWTSDNHEIRLKAKMYATVKSTINENEKTLAASEIQMKVWEIEQVLEKQKAEEEKSNELRDKLALKA